MTQEQKVALAMKWGQNDQGMTLKEFVASAQPGIGMDDAVIVKWGSMWLAVETDGYTHS